ncbi:asparaginase [Devosia pacifica]|uniref:Asparaginase n=1 Tax=Devosia pacifica TaxID=1335967 RepID=A0A918SAJ4_9HYPH|nr:asparaginase [Devosia pacifica]GHA29626.1 asparaginase [Devosia pacifica]
MSANPVLAEASRGNSVENRHRGAAAIVDASGTIIASIGDLNRPIFPRSAVKSMQALAIFTSGAWDQGLLDQRELALACASHHGEAVHTEAVGALLAKLGLSENDLECGAHQPTNAAARRTLREKAEAPTQLHNNCSGKHAGMLAVARALGIDPRGYVGIDHPVQQEVRNAIEAVIGEPLTVDRCGTDGCSIPTFAAPLKSFAYGFARMATGEGLEPRLAEASQMLFDAAAAHPHLIAGTDHADTRLLGGFGNKLMQKSGAEGVQCGALRAKGWGYALKCDDGNLPASFAMLAGLLEAHADLGEAQAEVLRDLKHQTLRNVRGIAVGEMRLAETFSSQWETRDGV